MTRFVPVLLALAASSALAAAGPTAQDQTFRSAAITVPIYATVLDRDGRLVTDLEREHFEILDNGKPQPLTVFKSDIQPITVVVMLDTSGSMTINLDAMKNAAEQFILRLLPDDRAKIGTFANRIIVSRQFTGDRDALIRTMRDEFQFGNPTPLWDAIDAGMNELAQESGRRVVLVFTDGDDSSSRLRSSDIERRALQEDFMVYGIGLESTYHNGRQMVTSRPDRRLRGIVEQSGGGYFLLTKAADLGATFSRVADELHRQYVLGFTPETLDGTAHKLEVRVKTPGTTVRARKSYVASRAALAEESAPAR